VTERVFASLANVLGQHSNLSPVPAELAEHTFEELEVHMQSAGIGLRRARAPHIYGE